MPRKTVKRDRRDEPLDNPSGRSKVPRRRPQPAPKKLSAAQKNELIEYFEERVARLNVVETTKTSSGQILDWIDMRAQHPEGRIANPPPPPRSDAARQRGRPTKMARFELQDQGSRLGPEGTVPVLRIDLKKLRFNKTLDDFLSKHGHRTVTRDYNGQPLEQPEVGGPHDYGATAESVNCQGGEGFISLFDPYTAHSDEFSLSQIGLETNREVGGRQTVEAGWQEFRDKYGDWIPHLFVFYTTNGYSKAGDNLGGYNQEVKGWVQYSRSVYPGAISNNVSTPGGQQWELFIKYQLYQGNWWLNVGGEWIGYYPASLFADPGLRNGADRLLFFGEIVDSASHTEATKTQMGTGYFAEYRWPYAAFQRLLRYQTDANGSMSNYDGSSIITDTKEYDTELHMNSGSNWGSYFWFGGPGAK
jgi:Neprosin